MIAVWALLLALQADPVIERVEPVVGAVRRPLLWTPLRVALSSSSDFTGDLVARSGFGFSIARTVTIKAGGREVVLLPAIDPAEIRVGQRTAKPPEAALRPDRIVLVDSRLPYAAELVSTDKILYQRISAEELSRLLPRGLLEAADLILVQEPMNGGTVASTREAAEKALSAVVDHPPSLEAADRAVWPIAPQENWVPTKKHWAVYFATVYAFAAFVALTVVAKRFPKFGLVAVSGVAVLGIAGYAAFPRSQMWIVSQAAEVVAPGGETREHRLWFVQSALEMAVNRLEFPRLVKPVFATTGGTDEPFTVRVDDRGCSVEGLKLLPGRAFCFGGEEGRPPAIRTDLRSAILVREGRFRLLGDLAAGAPVPVDVPESGIPPGAQFDAWKRFVGNDGLFGIRPGTERPAATVKSADLADERDRPMVFIQRFK
jgi:hypothetical protein